MLKIRKPGDTGLYDPSGREINIHEVKEKARQEEEGKKVQFGSIKKACMTCNIWVEWTNGIFVVRFCPKCRGELKEIVYSIESKGGHVCLFKKKSVN